MCPQTACLRGCIVTLVAFVRFFSTVRFQMCPQSTGIKVCTVTLVAFVWLISTVGFLLLFKYDNAHCRRYYESDTSRLGQRLPKPKIKHTKKIGETLLHKLSWGDEAGGEWLEDDWFQTLSENLISESTNVSCNTRKSRDKRERRHTVGVFLGAFPCGIIVIGNRVLKFVMTPCLRIAAISSHISESQLIGNSDPN